MASDDEVTNGENFTENRSKNNDEQSGKHSGKNSDKNGAGSAVMIDSEVAIARAARVRLMIFDVDGILTDGSLHFGADGEVIKTFNVLDGHGIKLLQQAGIATAIISARKSPIVLRRSTDLGIIHVVQGAHDKRDAFMQLLQQTGIGADACGFIGDDVIDLPILMRVAFAASVPNGHAEVRARVHYVTHADGGRGAVRELCDFILRAQSKYDAALAPYLT